MLEDLLGPPIWWPENSVNNWNLLWLCSLLMVGTKPKDIYKKTFPYTVTSKMAKNLETSIFFGKRDLIMQRHNPEIQNVSKRRTLLSWKVDAVFDLFR